jgi:hypothetical protein
MNDARNSLLNVEWNAELAGLLADCIAAISRLDARVSASFFKQSWLKRASYRGFAAALRAQHIELEEIDVFNADFGIVSDRDIDRRNLDIVSSLPKWQTELDARPITHWNENLPFSFDPPPNWETAPQLLRALEVNAFWSRHDHSIDCWLRMPQLLHSMNITSSPLPCLAGGDPAFRSMPRNAEGNLRRSLKRLTRAAQDGSHLLDGLERLVSDMTRSLSSELRRNSLKTLCIMILDKPVITPVSFARSTGLSTSGSGKLMKRAVALGIISPIKSASSWKMYIARDMATRLNIIKAPVGRPAMTATPARSVDDILEQFNKEWNDVSDILNRYM